MTTSNIRPLMLGTLGIGILSAIFLPAMKISIISFFGAMPMEISLREASNAMVNTGRGWAVALAVIGVVILMGTVLRYNDNEKTKSLGWLIGGTVLTLLFPLNLLRAMADVVGQVTEESDGLAMVDTSLSAGVIIGSIAAIIVAALGWYGNAQESEARTRETPSTPLYNLSKRSTETSWPSDVQ